MRAQIREEELSTHKAQLEQKVRTEWKDKAMAEARRLASLTFPSIFINDPQQL